MLQINMPVQDTPHDATAAAPALEALVAALISCWLCWATCGQPAAAASHIVHAEDLAWSVVPQQRQTPPWPTATSMQLSALQGSQPACRAWAVAQKLEVPRQVNVLSANFSCS